MKGAPGAESGCKKGSAGVSGAALGVARSRFQSRLRLRFLQGLQDLVVNMLS